MIKPKPKAKATDGSTNTESSKTVGKSYESKRELLNQQLSSYSEEVVMPGAGEKRYEEIPLSSLQMMKDNSRTRHINAHDPLTNPLPEDHPDYQETQDTIEGIRQLSEHLKVEPLEQPIVVYHKNNRYPIIAGNRRYLALKLAFGDEVSIMCSVYDREPSGVHKKRFYENYHREKLSLSSQLMDFKRALEDIHSQIEGHPSVRKVAELMGVSKTHVNVFMNACKNESCFNAVMAGEVATFKDMKAFLANLPKSDDERRGRPATKNETEAGSSNSEPESAGVLPQQQGVSQDSQAASEHGTASDQSAGVDVPAGLSQGEKQVLPSNTDSSAKGAAQQGRPSSESEKSPIRIEEDEDVYNIPLKEDVLRLYAHTFLGDVDYENEPPGLLANAIAKKIEELVNK